MDEQRRQFLEMESASDKDAVEIADMTVKDIEYYQNLMKQQQDSRGQTCFESSSTMGKTLLNSIACYRKSQSRQQTFLFSYFKKLPQPLHPSPTTTLISQQSALSSQAKRLLLPGGSNGG